jgi:hypothetical protein
MQTACTVSPGELLPLLLCPLSYLFTVLPKCCTILSGD